MVRITYSFMALSGILASVIWMNGRFNSLEKDMAIVKTVMIMKGIMPTELAVQEGIK